MSKFNKLRSYNIENLTNDWIFMSLTRFSDNVEKECLLDYDGYGEFIYIDKDGIMYTKEDECIHPSDIHDLISEAAKGKIIFDCFDAAEVIREKYTEGDYKLFAIFWYNK